ncbi:MAG: hypothetical protein ACKV2V_09420 [Blastocatellia bacterium]
MVSEMMMQACGACGMRMPAGVSGCPKCMGATPAHNPVNKQVRVRGMLMMILGGGLAGGMMFLISVISNAMIPRQLGGAGSFTGTPRDAAFIYAILGAVLVFGVTGFVAGLGMVTNGRQNRALTVAVLLIGLLILALTVTFYILA